MPTASPEPAILAGKRSSPDPTPGYADFVRQRKDDVARDIRAHRERRFWQAQAIADHRARLAFEREQAQADRELADFWRRVRRKLPRQRIERQAPGRRQIQSAVRAATMRPLKSLPAYRGPLLDRKGRQSVFVAVRYLGAKAATIGCARRLVYYIVHPDHIEQDGLIGDAFLSNVGETPGEIASGFDLLEDMNRAARSNAKVVFHIIVQLPHDVSPEERLHILRSWCDLEFGARDLPYVAALHTPSEEGDQRNFHGHVAFSTRPMVRTEPYAWDVGRELKRECDNAKAFRAMRHDFAAIMTAASQALGKDRVYTGLTYAERGMKTKPTAHVGAHKTRLARQGEHVAEVERNRLRIARNEALVEAERLKARARTLDTRRRRVREALSRLVSPIVRAARPEAPLLVAIGVMKPADRSAQRGGPLQPPTPVDRPVSWHRAVIAPPARGDRAPADVRRAAIAALVPAGRPEARTSPVDRPVQVRRPRGDARATPVPYARAKPVGGDVQQVGTTGVRAVRPQAAPAHHSHLAKGIVPDRPMPATVHRTPIAIRLSATAIELPAMTLVPIGSKETTRNVAGPARTDRPAATPSVDMAHLLADLFSDKATERRRRAKRHMQVAAPKAELGVTIAPQIETRGSKATRRSLFARVANIDWGEARTRATLDDLPRLDAVPPIGTDAPKPEQVSPSPIMTHDGFGGWREGSPPSFRWRDLGGVNAKAFTADGRPSRSLLILLEFAGRRPADILFADDQRLIVQDDAPPMIASLVQGWRHDDAVEALVVETVRESRAAGRPVWPPALAPAIRALAGSDRSAGRHPDGHRDGRDLS